MRKFALSMMVSFISVLGFGGVASAQYVPPTVPSTTLDSEGIPATGLADFATTASFGFLLIGLGLIAVTLARAAHAQR